MFVFKDSVSFLFRLETKAETIVGDDILYLHSNSDYNVHFPIYRGEINVTSGVGKLFTFV